MKANRLLKIKDYREAADQYLLYNSIVDAYPDSSWSHTPDYNALLNCYIGLGDPDSALLCLHEVVKDLRDVETDKHLINYDYSALDSLLRSKYGLPRSQ